MAEQQWYDLDLDTEPDYSGFGVTNDVEDVDVAAPTRTSVGYVDGFVAADAAVDVLGRAGYEGVETVKLGDSSRYQVWVMLEDDDDVGQAEASGIVHGVELCLKMLTEEGVI